MTMVTAMHHISAYLRASTDQQDPTRAKELLQEFVAEKSLRVSSWYIETASGANAERPQLRRLLDEAQAGDILLIEAVDRLTRLTNKDWQDLKQTITAKKLKVVSLDLPTSYQALLPTLDDTFTSVMLDAINSMMLDMLAAISRKDYEQRRDRQLTGINKARAKGKYKGRKPNLKKHEAILKIRASGHTVSETAEICGVSISTVTRVSRSLT
jgi:DNA invertase Pin-like site-specific DNA recombinase